MSKKHPNLVKIGSRIREIRKIQLYSQEALADASQLDRAYIGRVERGEQNISVQNLIRIAITLDAEISDLIPPIAELKKARK